MIERDDSTGSRTGEEEYGGVNQGAPGDADAEEGDVAGGVADIDEPRQDGPNQGAPGDAPSGGEAA